MSYILPPLPRSLHPSSLPLSSSHNLNLLTLHHVPPLIFFYSLFLLFRFCSLIFVVLSAISPPPCPWCTGSSWVRHYQPNDPDVTLMLAVTPWSHNCFCVLCLYAKQQNMYFVFWFFFSKHKWSKRLSCLWVPYLTPAFYNCNCAPFLHIHDVCHFKAWTDLTVWTKSMAANVWAHYLLYTLTSFLSLSQPQKSRSSSDQHPGQRADARRQTEQAP